MKCRVCGTETSFLETVHGCRKSAVGEICREKPYNIDTGNVELFKCQCCGHIQTRYELDETFYDDYEGGSGLDQYYGDNVVLDKQFSKLAALSNGNMILEIGCGTGNAIPYSAKYFSSYLGVEPSQKESFYAELMISRIKETNGAWGGGINRGYFNENFEFNRLVDAFCSFQVFEHLEDVRTPLKKAESLLRTGGVGLINVPNGGQIMEERLFHQINFEHINYFTPNSLAYLCRECGFEVIDLESDRRAIELNVYVRKSSIGRKHLSTAEAEIAEQLNAEIQNAKGVAVYGAGAKTLYYGRLLDKKKIKILLDGDVKKTGRYIGGMEVPISLYRQGILEKNEVDTVIVFASSYNKEIIKMIKKDGFQGKIIYFEKDVVKRA